MKRISKEELAKRLAHAVGLEEGKEGLGTMIYGWFHYRRYGKKYRKAVYNRDWLYITEAIVKLLSSGVKNRQIYIFGCHLFANAQKKSYLCALN